MHLKCAHKLHDSRIIRLYINRRVRHVARRGSGYSISYAMWMLFGLNHPILWLLKHIHNHWQQEFRSQAFTLFIQRTAGLQRFYLCWIDMLVTNIKIESIFNELFILQEKWILDDTNLNENTVNFNYTAEARIILKRVFKKWDWGTRAGLNSCGTGTGTRGRTCECCDEPSGSVKCGIFFFD